MTNFTDLSSVTRADIEALFFTEARMLDGWDLAGWLDLLTLDAIYVIPSLDRPDDDPDNSLSLVADDRKRIETRVGQLLGSTAWAENPRSRTRRLVSNVLILDRNEMLINAEANFAVWRFKNGHTDLYVGRYVYGFALVGERLAIRSRRAILDLETLRPHGKLSFIL